ncbi:MFS transporter [Candidatus Micrarchaeota archaeon]|nr:MFS transporter [Candidatus Micrarchaeota archaeon]
MNNIQKIYLLTFLGNITIFASISVPFFLEWGKINFTELFLVEMVFVGTLALAQVPTGAFADKYGRKISMIVGVLLGIVSLFVLVSTPNVWIFALAEFIGGLGAAFTQGADDALVYDTLKEEKREKTAKSVFANKNIASSLGLILGAPIGTIIAGASILPAPENYRMVFLLTVIPATLTLLVAFTLRERKHAKKVETEALLHTSLKGLKDVVKNPKVLAMALDWSIVAGMGFFMFWLYQPLLKESGVDITYWGFVSAGYNTFAMVLLAKIGWIDKKLGTRTVLLGSAIAIGTGYLGAMLTRNPLVIVPVIFIVAGLNVARTPLFTQVINEQLPSERRATGMSTVGMFRDVMRFLLYPIIGFVTDISLNLSFLLLGGTILIVVGLLQFFEWKNK